MGHVYQRPESPFWYVSYVDAAGRTKRISTGIVARRDNKHEAKDFLREKEREAALRSAKPRRRFRRPEELKLSDLKRLVLADYKTNDLRSARNVETGMRNVIRFFGDVAAEDIDLAQLRAYMAARRAKGVALATIYRDLSALHRGFKLAEAYGVRVPDFPARKKLQNARQGFFLRDELDDVVGYLTKYERGVFVFTYLTGWRISEACSRLWSHVNFDEGYVFLTAGETKEKYPRVFPFAVLPELRECLEQQRDLAVETADRLGRLVPWVFFTERGRRFNPRSGPNSALRKAWARALGRAGHEGRFIHDFRRSAARNLIRAGVPESEAMKITGHKTDRVFRAYNISTLDDHRVSVGRLAQYFARLAAERNVGRSGERDTAQDQRDADLQASPTGEVHGRERRAPQDDE